MKAMLDRNMCDPTDTEGSIVDTCEAIGKK
jgi:hypothetical protein